MKSTLTMTSDETPPSVELPMMAQMFSATVSAVAVLLAVARVDHLVGGHAALVWLLYVQATLLAVVAHGIAAAADERLGRWEARVAPDRARSRVRSDVALALARAAALGFAGPLVLAVDSGWQEGDLRPVLGALAVLATAFGASFCAACAWRGRAPRWMALLAIASLVVVLAVPGAVAALCHDGALALVTMAFAALMSWRCMAARQAFAVSGPPLPRPDVRLWWRRASAQRGWIGVRYQQPWKTMNGETRQSNAWTVFVFLPQFLIQARWLELLAWGQTYTHFYAGPAYAAWLMCLTSFAYGGLIAPRLHWRRRLAPRSLSAQQWARRLVLGSMLAGAALFSVGVALAMGINSLSSHPMHGDAWLPGLGDVLLASSFGAWLRGRYERQAEGWMFLIGAGLACAAILPLLALVTLPLLGVVPQRGAVWLLLQLALVLPLTRAAIRAWSRRDLNLMA